MRQIKFSELQAGDVYTHTGSTHYVVKKIEKLRVKVHDINNIYPYMVSMGADDDVMVWDKVECATIKFDTVYRTTDGQNQHHYFLNKKVAEINEIINGVEVFKTLVVTLPSGEFCLVGKPVSNMEPKEALIQKALGKLTDAERKALFPDGVKGH